MAAKSGGDSKQGLIITLVIFILLTIILGVTTYLGFSGQTQLEKDKKTAEDDKKLYDQDGDWYKFQALAYRTYMGAPLSAKEKESYDVLRAKFDQGGLSTRDPEKASVTELIKNNLDKTYGWDAANKKAGSTAADQIAALNKNLQANKTTSDQLKASLQEEQTSNAALKKGLQDEQTKNKAALEKLRSDMNAELTKYRDQVSSLEASLRKQGDEIAELKKSNDDALRAHKKEMAAKDKNIKDLKDRITKNDLDEEQKKLEHAQSQAQWTRLDTDKPRGKVTFLNGNGQMPFIDLGSADGVKPGLRFTVHGTEANGKASLTAKATLEVIEAIKPHMSQARLVKVVDPAVDPVIIGDKLFNPAWEPNRKTHVAIAGVVDLSGNKRDGLKEFMQELTNQGIEVDAYIDLKDGEMKGEVSRKTDFLILGGSFDDSNLRWIRDKDKLAAANKRVKEMQDTAVRNGVKTIRLQDFLSATGSPAAAAAETPAYNLRSGAAPGGR